jgi:Ca2+-binding RTX toxin-like protein
MATINGTNGDDTLPGTSGDDTIHGLGGSDHIDGDGGNDSLYGDAGADFLDGGDGEDKLYGGTGFGVLTGGAGADGFYFDTPPDEPGDPGGFENIVDFTATDDTIYLRWSQFSGIAAEGTLDEEAMRFSPFAQESDDRILYDPDTGNIYYDPDGTGLIPRMLFARVPANTPLNNLDFVVYANPTTGAPIVGTDAGEPLNGTGAADRIEGRGGDDTINGMAGDDLMIGGTGSDTFYADSSEDEVVEAPGDAGTDTVISSADYWIPFGVENLVLTGSAGLTGTGNSAANTITGSDGGDVLLAAGGNDTVYGGNGDDFLDGGDGADHLEGGAGNDRYVLAAGDTLVEAAGGGIDTVRTAIDGYTLQDNFEYLVLLAGALSGTGNSVANRIVGNDAANTLDGAAGADLMIGGLGDDIYIVDDAGDVASEGSTTGGYDEVRSSVSFSLAGQYVEKLVLTGSGAISGTGNSLANFILGNSAANVLKGGEGNDTLDGGAGADRMEGGAGDDTYYVDNASDKIVESSSGGSDKIFSSINFSLAGLYVEALELTGSAVKAVGNSLANTLTGNDLDNVLDGQGGADLMIGGTGDDLYLVDDSADNVVEAYHSGNGGTDTVRSSATYSLENRAYVENLTLTGNGNIDGTGNNNANVLIGNAGNNVLDGRGGADTMRGGAGDDTYRVGFGDTVEEAAGQGIDTIITFQSYSIVGMQVENIVLDGGSAINATGNGLSNVLTGNSRDNILDGGTGADTLTGGLGNDTYVVDNVGDVVIEENVIGFFPDVDTVRSSISYTLGDTLERLTLTGNNSISGTGNALDNILVGNSGANVLNGGTGADIMQGGLGNDTYIVDNVNDKIGSEDSGGGIDTVKSSVSYSLASGALETLILTGTAANGTGNGIANTIIGNGANNTINGGDGSDDLYGKSGSDTLGGGNGNDRFYFDTALGSSNVDTVSDFAVFGDDSFMLSRSVFGAIAEGTLSSSAFVAGTAAQDADDRIVYDSATGKIFYDADGSGAGAAVLFAQVTAGTSLTNLDFVAYMP